MMKVRICITLLSLICLPLLAACGGATARDLPVVGFLQAVSSAMLQSAREGFTAGLADAGFVDGKSVRIIFKNAGGDTAAAERMAREFVDQRVDLIAPASTPALQAALKSTSEIPIVFSAVADPFVAGAGTTDDRHLPNVTGVYITSPVDQVLRLITEMMPGVRHVGTLYDPNEVFSAGFQTLARQTADALSLELVEIAANRPEQIGPGVQALKSRGVQAIMQLPSNVMYAGIDGEIAQAKDLGMPLFSAEINHPASGAVAALGLDFRQASYEAGQMAARVLRGEKPADIPFQAATQEVLVLNTEAARHFDITVPRAVLQRADRVVARAAN